MTPNRYVNKLYSRQRAEGWSTARMAAELGISQVWWHYILSGQRQPSIKFIKRAMRRFPEYDSTALAMLREDDGGGIHATGIEPAAVSPDR
jgi:transcriptional regulator with XRE-family HTH domain